MIEFMYIQNGGAHIFFQEVLAFKTALFCVIKGYFNMDMKTYSSRD